MKRLNSKCHIIFGETFFEVKYFLAVKYFWTVWNFVRYCWLGQGPYLAPTSALHFDWWVEMWDLKKNNWEMGDCTIRVRPSFNTGKLKWPFFASLIFASDAIGNCKVFRLWLNYSIILVIQLKLLEFLKNPLNYWNSFLMHAEIWILGKVHKFQSREFLIFLEQNSPWDGNLISIIWCLTFSWGQIQRAMNDIRSKEETI